jgi:hypothetical protein
MGLSPTVWRVEQSGTRLVKWVAARARGRHVVPVADRECVPDWPYFVKLGGPRRVMPSAPAC